MRLLVRARLVYKRSFYTIQFMNDTSLEHIEKCRDKKRKRENDERIEVKLE